MIEEIFIWDSPRAAQLKNLVYVRKYKEEIQTNTKR